MSNLTLPATPAWNDTINQVETTESILGGANGNANLATKQLAENILWLRQKLESSVSESIKVGDTYTTTINHANAAAVATHHGYGTWGRFAEGRTLVGFSDNAADATEYKTMGNEFGENEHQLTIDEMPVHTPKLHVKSRMISGDDTEEGDDSVAAGLPGVDGFIDSIGGDQAHNNIQPSRVVGHWLRTA